MPEMADLDGDSPVMTITNLASLPYFVNYDSDWSLFSFAPLLDSEIGTY
jgi:hypothetical protein